MPPGTVAANISGFVVPDWRWHFSSRRHGMILVDTRSRCLFFWSEDLAVFRLYPCSVPIREEYTRRGRTQVVQKVKDPAWRPTPSMLARHPDWPRYLPPGPGNPLGTHALYLGWPAFRIHGTHDDNKIGRRSSSGCFGLYNRNIAELFALVEVGTQVRVI
ncbi:MAG TPA: L,D-transpeptidase [Tabrizicola sp.]